MTNQINIYDAGGRVDIEIDGVVFCEVLSYAVQHSVDDLQTITFTARGRVLLTADPRLEPGSASDAPVCTVCAGTGRAAQ